MKDSITAQEQKVATENRLTTAQYLAMRYAYCAKHKKSWDELTELNSEDLHVINSMGVGVQAFLAGKLEDIAKQVVVG